jgi:hypothetical protein
MTDRKHDLELILRLADNIASHNGTYSTRGAANEVRNVVRELAEALRQQELSALNVDQLVTRAEDCYEEITRRSLLAINGPSRSA